VVAGDFDVAFRGRIELSDPEGRVKKNAYQSARGLEPAAASELVEAAERIAVQQAAAGLKALRDDDVGSCAVVVGASAEAPLESILASHALAHAAEGRMYQCALLRGAESLGLEAVAVPKQSIREHELWPRLDDLRRELGPPWAEDQKLAALAAWISLAR
jgi:hypothetical protein